MDKENAQPGQTVSPSTSDPAAQSPPPAPSDPSGQPKPSEAPAPTPPPEPQPQPPAPAPEPSPQPEDTPDRPPFEAAAEELNERDASAAPEYLPDDDEVVSWTASEFIAHAKSFKWYAALTGAAIVFAALVYLVTRDYISVGVVLLAAAVFGYYAGHQPRELQYQLDAGGLTIGNRHLDYGQFRSFSVLPEGAFSSIVFMPLRRFAVPTTIYYAPEDEEKIVGMLEGRLPLDPRGHDAIDRLMHRIRF